MSPRLEADSLSRAPTESVISVEVHQDLLDKLARQSRVFDATLSAITDFAYCFDRDGRFTYVNKALLDLWGLKLEDAVGKDFAELKYPPDLAAKLQRQIQQVFQTARGLSDETPYTSPTGKGGYYEYIFAPVFDAGGAVEAVAGSTRDITARKRTELDLLEANERLESSLLAGEIGTWALDVAARKVFADVNVRRMFCLPPGTHRVGEDLSSFMNAIHPEDRALAIDGFQNATRDPKHIYRVEHRVPQPDGSDKWIVVRGKAERGVGGQPLRARGVVLDATDRRKADLEREQLLNQVRIEREKLADAFRQSPAFMAVMRGPEHVFEVVNDQYLQLIGKRDIIGKAVRQAVPEVEGQGFFEILDRVYSTGQPFIGRGMTIKLRRRPDGLLEEVYVDFVYQPMRNADNTIVGIMAHDVDVTERTRAERALVESQQRLHTLFDNTQDAILLTDDQMQYVDVNPAACALTGYSRQELLQLKVWDITPLPDQATGNRLWREFIAQGKQGGEYSITRKDGSTVAVEYRAVANILPGLHLSVLRDVTERKRAEAAMRENHQALEAANKAKDQFLAVLSHELRTPLSPVVMTLAAMELHPDLPYELREDVAMIRRNIDLETKLIDDLLDLSRVTSGKLRLHIQRTRLHEVLRHTFEVCTSDINNKQLSVEMDFTAVNDNVMGDAARLEQVFWNLLKNAIKFSHERGSVLVKTSNPAPDTITVEVIDAGVGIVPEVLSRVFDAFEQGDARVTRQFGGLGLGLAISKAVVDMHGGTIRASSAGAGFGATFIVEIKTTSDAVPHQEHSLPQPGANLTHANARILLVEDHHDTARILTRLLKAYGYGVRVVNSVASALQAASEEPFDLLVSDIGLPDASGYELMQKLKLLYGMQGIALTGYGMEDDMRRGREAGFADHVVKPINFSQLDAVIRRVLGNNA